MRNLHELNIANFPDGHKHLILKKEDLGYYDLEEVAISIRSFDDLFLLAQLKQICPNLIRLQINYLLGARCDRQFSEGEAVDLQIIGKFLNSLKFKEINILKPHSIRSLQYIDNSYEFTMTKDLLQQCIMDNNLIDYSIISPDKGASQWITKELGNEGIIQCNKVREGGVVKSVTFTDTIKETCIIVDDLCDGGATFIELAKELKAHGAKDVYLIVTHGIFSRGFNELEKYLTKIYFTNSFLDKDDITVNFGDISYSRQVKFIDNRLIQLKIK